jgi:hypothetical protein
MQNTLGLFSITEDAPICPVCGDECRVNEIACKNCLREYPWVLLLSVRTPATYSLQIASTGGVIRFESAQVHGRFVSLFGVDGVMVMSVRIDQIVAMTFQLPKPPAPPEVAEAEPERESTLDRPAMKEE